MTHIDLVRLQDDLSLIDTMKIIGPDDNVAIHSAWPDQEIAMREYFGNDIESITVNEWNILEEKYLKHFRMIVFCNVFMYIRDPRTAFKNVLKSCDYCLMQDVIKRDRGINIFGTDGDGMRYKFGEIDSNYKEAFDIRRAGKVIYFSPYSDSGRFIHFTALIKSMYGK